MVKRIIALIFIYLCTVFAWLILGTTINIRTHSLDSKLKAAVGQLWGTVQKQQAPALYYETEKETKVLVTQADKLTTETKKETVRHPVTLEGSDIAVDLNLDYRRKGFLWYSTYKVGFKGKYRLINPTEEPRRVYVDFTFPLQGAVYDNFKFVTGGVGLKDIQPREGHVVHGVDLQSGQSETIEIAYDSQGMGEWWYEFGEAVSQVRDFSLKMTTDFDKIDFPQSAISPTSKEKRGEGWLLKWEYKNLLSGVQIGMVMPEKLNPGPWVSRVTFSAPISLFLFFFLLFIITTRKETKVHPMNFFFLAAAFFAFHLLLAYMVDHVSIHAAFLISSAVSIFLVVSYMRIVAGPRFAFLETGLTQFVYLVLFSYTFFFEEYTGLAVTILCVITLFIVMQYTARVDWSAAFKRREE